uniref:Uncharacterized protein n=1 Tax=Anopheles culicifacies TaxID=139723 RepID=A0A182M4J4_9DIPT
MTTSVIAAASATATTITTTTMTKDVRTHRSSLYDRSHPVPSRPASLPTVPAYPGNAVSSRPSRSATRPVGSNPFTSQTAGMRVFKKCKSATFQIDGHTYTIGKFVLVSLLGVWEAHFVTKGVADRVRRKTKTFTLTQKAHP